MLTVILLLSLLSVLTAHYQKVIVAQKFDFDEHMSRQMKCGLLEFDVKIRTCDYVTDSKIARKHSCRVLRYFVLDSKLLIVELEMDVNSQGMNTEPIALKTALEMKAMGYRTEAITENTQMQDSLPFDYTTTYEINVPFSLMFPDVRPPIENTYISSDNKATIKKYFTEFFSFFGSNVLISGIRGRGIKGTHRIEVSVELKLMANPHYLFYPQNWPLSFWPMISFRLSDNDVFKYELFPEMPPNMRRLVTVVQLNIIAPLILVVPIVECPQAVQHFTQTLNKEVIQCDLLLSENYAQNIYTRVQLTFKGNVALASITSDQARASRTFEYTVRLLEGEAHYEYYHHRCTDTDTGTVSLIIDMIAGIVATNSTCDLVLPVIFKESLESTCHAVSTRALNVNMQISSPKWFFPAKLMHGFATKHVKEVANVLWYTKPYMAPDQQNPRL